MVANDRMPADLVRSYERCRLLARQHGRTFYLATWLLPAGKRRHVHALYGFCRHADDIVDDMSAEPAAARRSALDSLSRRLFAGLEGGELDDAILPAVVHTVRAFAIDPGCFERFLASMAMDLTVSSYERFEDLVEYMDGSAAAIGEMLLPILGPDAAGARRPAQDLGIAFQLTNFIRDVGEDLARGRVYLPQRDLRRFGAEAALVERRVTPEWTALLRFEIERARAYYAAADRGIGLLPGRSARCVRTARVLYAQILDRVEANGYDVFTRRAAVPPMAKLATAARQVIAGGTGTADESG